MLTKIDMDDDLRTRRVLSKNIEFARRTVMEFFESDYDAAEVTGWPNDKIDIQSKRQSLNREIKRSDLVDDVKVSTRAGKLLLIRKVLR